MTQKKSRVLKTALWYVPACLFAGAVNGLLGAGGGVIMLYIVAWVLKRYSNGADKSDAGKDAFASVIAVILPVSVVSAMSYAGRGAMEMGKMQILALPALVGGILGAYLTDKLPTKVIRAVFAVLVVISGLRMI